MRLSVEVRIVVLVLAILGPGTRRGPRLPFAAAAAAGRGGGGSATATSSYEATVSTTGSGARRGNQTSAMSDDHSNSDERAAVSSPNAGRGWIVFSDIDGTLVHYPEEQDVAATAADDDDSPPSSSSSAIVRLPASATGTVGIISARTLRLAGEVRRRRGGGGGGGSTTRLILVTGARTPTLLNRLPYLPRADAYCSEGGGRIFVSESGAAPPAGAGGYYQVTPVPYEGATEEDLEPYFLREDMEWRRRMEEEGAAGKGAFLGNELSDYCGDSDVQRQPQKKQKQQPNSLPQGKGDGVLWTFAREKLIEEMGLVLDAKGYSACFRINREQQTTPEGVRAFDDLLGGKLMATVPPSVATSTNIGCIDFYPSSSGKKNCCRYVAEKFLGDANLLATRCVCLCDDDNDVEMALACAHAYIPSITSASMEETIRAHQDHFTPTFRRKDEDAGVAVEGTSATEAALSLALERIATDADDSSARDK